MKIVVIGGGNMGKAMVKAWLNSKVFKASDVLVIEKNSTNQKDLKSLKVKVSTADYSKIAGADMLMLAVKPQDFDSVLKTVKPFVKPKTIVLSIAAGITIKRMEKLLGRVKLVRAMPNMPAQIQMGMTGWTTNKLVTATERQKITRLFEALGAAIYVASESKINAITAISGSGPAYIFYFMEALFDAAQELGLTKSEAQTLVLNTFVGAPLMTAMGDSPADLRAKVTSKKGTTEAAIKVFDRKKTKQIIIQAAQAAFQRAKELSQ